MHPYRTHTCAQLSASEVGQTVRLSGWIHRKRDHGGVLFVDLRDHYGITQIVADSDSPALPVLDSLRAESVVTIEGEVKARAAETVNANLTTGAIEVFARSVTVQSAAEELPLPVAGAADMRSMLFTEMEAPVAPRMFVPEPEPVAASEVLERIAAVEGLHEDRDAPVVLDIVAAVEEAEQSDGVVVAMLAEMLADPDSVFQPEAFLYQDFSVRCRMAKLKKVPLDLAAFRRRFALAKGGVFDPAEPRWAEALRVAERLPDDMLAPFLQIARAAIGGEPCPDDDVLGRAYGSHSPGRIRRLVEYMEKQGAIVVRSDFGGRRSIGIPELGLSTEAE